MEINKETGEVKQATKGKGSFWISKQAIGVLLDQKATAMQIAAYLVIAKHTDENGKFSSSGIKAIHKATGVSHTIAERAVAALMQMKQQITSKQNGLVYMPDEWSKLTKEAIPPAPFERAQVRYVINDFKAKPEDRIWFSNELVTGIGKFTQPLKRLKMCGDVAARLLLISYRENNLEQYGGISPRAFNEQYKMQKIADLHGYDLWHGEHTCASVYDSVSLPSLGLTTWPKDKDEKTTALQPFWEAINALDKTGFIYQMVSVMDREAGNDEAQVIYELDTKSKHGYKPKGEEGVAGMTAQLSAAFDHPVTDSMGRFYDKYAAIVPAGNPHIIGIYRLRFRVSNTKNHGVIDAWARIYQGQREVKNWIDILAERYGMKI